MTFLNICICVAPGATLALNRIERDLFLSHEIWYPISFHIKKIIMLDDFFTFYDQEISYKTSFRKQKKVWRLLNYCKSVSPKTDLYVIYVGGNYFREQHVIGCAYAELHGPFWKGFIIITNTASSHSNKLTLAHEIGHILLTRRTNGILTNEDPHSDDGSQHHPNPSNLMYPVVPNVNHVHKLRNLLTEQQKNIALQSPLLHDKYEYREERW